MPKYMIDMIIGLAEKRKQKVVDFISSKLRENNYSFKIEKVNMEKSGLMYWICETEDEISDTLLKEIKGEINHPQQPINLRLTIKLL